jgi:phosphate starvation-inducible PhoH-like protein
MFLKKCVIILSLLTNSNSFKVFKSIPSRNIQVYSKKDKFTNYCNNNYYKPKTINQKKYVDSLNDDISKIVISYGPAGTGKTMFACLKAINLLKSGVINKIIITRPIVPVEEEEIGFLPGNIVKKMDPWTKPIFDLFLEQYSKTELDNLIYRNIIEICPLAFMRGRTFKNAFIIADEMQNSSPNQMKMLTTRIGINSKIVITGDLQQTDILKYNGLHDFISKVNNYNDTSKLINIIELNNHDIERSEIVKKVIDIYNYNPIISNNNKITITKRTYKKSNDTKINKTKINKTKINKTKLNETSIKLNETKINDTNTKIVETKLNINVINNDAALIPRKHISKYHTSPDFNLFFENPQF